MANVLTTAFAANPLTDAIIERYMDERVLSVASRKTVFWKLGRMVKLPEGESKTISFERFERLTAPRKALTEGVTPVGKKLVVNKVLAVAVQWGDFLTFTDVVVLTVRHEPIQRGLELLGLDAAMTVDREVQRTLIGGSSIYFPNGRADRTALLSTDFPNTKLFSKTLAALSRKGAPAYEGGRFCGVCDPENMQDIQNDGTFIPAAQYSNLTALQEAEVGIWKRVRWMESNNIPVLVRNTDCDPASLSVSALQNLETVALADGDYRIRLVGLDDQGFETDFSVASAAQTIAAGNDAVHFSTPAFPLGIVAFNVYANKDAGIYTLQLADAGESAAYSLNGDGLNPTSGTGIQYTTDGLVAGVIPPVDVNVHTMYVFGNEYFSCVELKGIQVLRTPPGPQKGDELDQRQSMGWKAFFCSKITNEDYGLRIECASDFD